MSMWSNIAQGKKVQKLRLFGTHRLRPVSEPVDFWRVWDGNTNKGEVVNPKTYKGELKPYRRWVFYAIDRQDGLVKEVEFSKSVMEMLHKEIKALPQHKNPWDIDGLDLTVTKQGTGISARFTVAVQPTFLTSIELADIENLPSLAATYHLEPTACDGVLTIMGYHLPCDCGKNRLCRKCRGTGNIILA